MTPRQKYYSDSNYHQLVDMMIMSIKNCEYTPSEMREAAILASIIYEENNLRRIKFIVLLTEKLEKALKVVHNFSEGKLS